MDETRSFLDNLGPRVLRRSEPRLGIAAAGAGCALAIVGILVIGGDAAFSNGDSSAADRIPGAALSGMAVAAGFLVLARVSAGPVATAATVASALGVPPLVFFITADPEDFPPFSVDAVLIVSALAWLTAWVLGPGRGRAFYLGAGLIALWMSVLQVTEGAFDLEEWIFFPFAAESIEFESTGEAIAPSGSAFESGDPFADDEVDIEVSGGFDSGGFDSGNFDEPNANTIGAISLGFGIGYLLLSRRFESQGRLGAATPALVAALPAFAFAVLALGEEFEQSGTGLLLAAIGCALAANGATTGRRLTTWIGGGAIAVGLGLLTTEPVDDATAVGTVLVLTGLAIVVLAELVIRALGEQPETEPGPSVLRRSPAAGPPPSADVDEVPPPDA